MPQLNGEREAFAGNLARNLRRVCKAKGNISDICRDIGINRQQFNKYLSGASLPSSHNMRKICTYFAVTEEYLLGKVDEAVSTVPPAAALGGVIDAIARDFATQPPRSFASGCYFAYYPMIADPTRLIRVLLVISREAGTVTFKRFTRVREAGVRTKYYPRGKHIGVVVQRGEMIFLLGVNKVGYQDISLMTFNALMNNSPNMRTGLALIMSPWGPLATRVTLEFIGAMTDKRRLMKRCQVLPIDSPEIDPLIRKSMVALSSWPTPQLEPYGHMEDWGPLQIVPRSAAGR